MAKPSKKTEPKEFSVRQTIEVQIYEKPVNVNDRDQVLRVEAKCNHAKGLFSVSPKAHSNLFTGNEDEDLATCFAFADLMAQAVKDLCEWQLEWKRAKARQERDPNQGELFDETEQFD